ncbi:MAG: metallophosphoesterase family protein [Frankia sp.]
MRLVLMSDTHLPRRARDLPPQLWAAVDDADVVVHAGDWVSLEFMTRLEARTTAHGGRLIGVWGNNDGDDLRARLPEVARVDLDGLRLAVVHETGPAAGREKRMAGAFADADVVVFGHSHIPWDSYAGPGGPRLLNPGSPTDRRRQPAGTYLTAGCEPGRDGRGVLTDVREHRIATP